MTLIERLLQPVSHYYCEDSWYSCPLSEEGCADERQTGCTCGASLESALRQQAAARLQSLEQELERCFQQLELRGVPRERAKSVSNGIDVLGTRFDKEAHFREQELERAREALERLGSMEAFCGSRMVGPHDNELMARISYARSAIENERKKNG